MNYYDKIKNELINNEVYKKVKDYSKNRNDLQTYYNVGELLVKAQGGEDKAKYGIILIKEYFIRLTNELGKGYSWTNLTILLPIKDQNKLNYYINQCIKNNLSKRKLKNKIKNKEYERLPIETRNKLINKEKVKLSDVIKDLIIKN